MASLAKSRFRTDRQLSVRMLTVMGTLVLAYAAALTVLVLLLGRWWPLGVAAVVGFLAFQLLSCDTVALRVAGAREADSAQEPRLHAIADRLCALADMPKPRLAVAPTPVPNAFAAGRRRKGVVLCVSRGMLDKLGDEELEGVLAHELAHVAHGDAAVMTVASFLGVLAGLTARLGARLMLIAGRARGLWQFLVLALAVTALATATWFVSILLVRALSRYREYAADHAAAQLTGNPAALASALIQSTAEAALIPQKDLRRATALNAFYFCPVHAAKATGRNLLSTHPSVEDRIARLEKMAAQLR